MAYKFYINKHKNILLIILILIMAFVSIVERNVFSPISADAAWLTVIAESLMEGMIYGRDIYDVNPPASALLYIPGAIIAKILNVNILYGSIIYLYITFILMLFLSIFVLKRSKFITSIEIYYLVLVLCFMSLVYNPQDFGQKEHFVILFIIPFLIMNAVQNEEIKINLYIRSMIGILLGIAYSIKPFFAIVPFLIAITDFMKYRSYKVFVRIEYLLSIIILIIYIAFVLSKFSDYTIWLKSIMNSNVNYYSVRYDPFLSLKTEASLYLITLVTFLCVFSWSRIQFKTRLCEIFFIASIGFFLCFLIQGKNWEYQAFPALFMQAVASSILIYQIGRSANRIKFVRFLFIGCLCFSQAITFTKFFETLRIVPKDKELVSEIVKITPNASMLALTESSPSAFPMALEANGRWVGSFSSAWIASFLSFKQKRDVLSGEIPVTSIPILQWQMDRITQDITNNKPDIIISHSNASWNILLSKFPRLMEALDEYDQVIIIDDRVILKRQQ